MTPSITLTATLDTLAGGAAGSVANPAKLRIALCGYGGTLPHIVGTANVAHPGPYPFFDTGAGINTLLWGNDQITPAGTWYEIAVLDGNDNVVQCAAYQFTGTQVIDLSNAAPYNPVPVPPPPAIPVLTNPPGAALQTILGSITINGNLVVTGTINGAGGIYVVGFNAGAPIFNLAGNKSQSLTLTGNATATITNIPNGVVFGFFIKQDATGGRTLVFPAGMKNPPALNDVPNGVTYFNATADETGTLYCGAAVWA